MSKIWQYPHELRVTRISSTLCQSYDIHEIQQRQKWISWTKCILQGAYPYLPPTTAIGSAAVLRP